MTKSGRVNADRQFIWFYSLDHNELLIGIKSNYSEIIKGSLWKMCERCNLLPKLCNGICYKASDIYGNNIIAIKLILVKIFMTNSLKKLLINEF